MEPLPGCILPAEFLAIKLMPAKKKGRLAGLNKVQVFTMVKKLVNATMGIRWNSPDPKADQELLDSHGRGRRNRRLPCLQSFHAKRNGRHTHLERGKMACPSREEDPRCGRKPSLREFDQWTA